MARLCDVTRLFVVRLGNSGRNDDLSGANHAVMQLIPVLVDLKYAARRMLNLLNPRT